ncbi:MAG: hypothetical protein CGW95_01140 [Phenylobacterium zucineum]|nr:MAG: hypothetical protein CGW95_01140 [Phenylobacterium zucineum]
MAALTVQSIVQAGLTPAYAAASAGGDTFQNTNDETTFLHVKCGATGATVTINPFITSLKATGIGQVTVAAISVIIAASSERMIGPFPQYVFTDTGGNVNVTYSQVATVTVAAIRVTPVSR